MRTENLRPIDESELDAAQKELVAHFGLVKLTKLAHRAKLRADNLAWEQKMLAAGGVGSPLSRGYGTERRATGTHHARSQLRDWRSGITADNAGLQKEPKQAACESSLINPSRSGGALVAVTVRVSALGTTGSGVTERRPSGMSLAAALDCFDRLLLKLCEIRWWLDCSSRSADLGRTTLPDYSAGKQVADTARAQAPARWDGRQRA